MFSRYGTLSLSRPATDDEEVMLVPSVRALRLRFEGGYQVVDSRKALWLFDNLDRTGQRDVRFFAAEARLTSFSHHMMDDQKVFALVRACIRDGRLVGIRRARSKVANASATVEHRRLVNAIDQHTRGRLIHQGRRYKLAADVDVDKVSGRNEYVVLPRATAAQVLTEIASEPGTAADLPPLLAEARAKLTKDWRAPLQPDGLVMLRKDISPRTVSVVHEPAITPSEMKAIVDEKNEEGEEPTIRLVNVEAPTFVPGAETIRISYAIDGPVAKAADVVMIVESVPAKGDRAVVESLAVPGPYAASGEVNWDGKAATPGGFLTLKGSPYEVTFQLTSKSGKTSKSGQGKLRIEVKDIKIVVDDKGPLHVAGQWKTTVGALIDGP
jgi:hypothetical protein